MKKNLGKTKFIVLMGLLIAMSVVGGEIKLPNPITSSIAFDSLPAFLGALLLGGVPGAIVGFLGHLASAAFGGFPLSLPVHIIVAFQMAIIMIVFSFVAKKTNLVVAGVVGIILNGIGSPACFIPYPHMGMAVFVALIPPLSVASTLNIIAAIAIYKAIIKTNLVDNFMERNNDGIQG